MGGTFFIKQRTDKEKKLVKKTIDGQVRAIKPTDKLDDRHKARGTTPKMRSGRGVTIQ